MGEIKKLPLGGVGSMGGDPSTGLTAPLTQGSQGLRIATGAEGPRNDNIRKGQQKRWTAEAVHLLIRCMY